MIIPGSLEVRQIKVDSLQKILTPLAWLRGCVLLGLANYNRWFVKNFSLFAKPLTILTNKDQPWTWGCEQQQAFETLKQKMDAAPILRLPDFSKSFQLHTNKISLILGAIFIQTDDFGQEYVIIYALQSNNTTEGNCEGKMLAAMWAIARFRPYVYGQRNTLVIMAALWRLIEVG